MAKLSVKDFSYYKDLIKEDEQTHQRRMMNKNLPDSVISAYEGFLFGKDDLENGRITDPGHSGGIQPHDPNSEDIFEDAQNVVENWLAISADVVIPGLYYQVPMPNIRNRPAGSLFTAEILNGLVRHFFDNKAKKENQRAILDAYLPYGYGVVKVGMNTRVGILNNKRGNFFTGDVKADGKDTDMESSVEYIKYARPFVERVSPRNTWLDWAREFGKGERVTFVYERTLQQLIDSNLYDLSSNFIQFFKATSGDNRKVKIRLKEHWIMLNGFAHKLVFTDDWHEELTFRKTPYQWLPISLLRFKEPPDVLYPRSHGAIARAGQDKYNYLGALTDEQLDHATNMTFVDETALTENGKKTYRENKFGAIVGTNRPPQGVALNVSSDPARADVLGRREQIRGYLQQVLSAGGAVSGNVEADTATQEKSVQLGNFLRTSGMQDQIRDFNVDQIKKMVTCEVNWGDPEVTVAITGKEVTDPLTGRLVTGQDIVIGGKEGIPLTETIIGNIESDYIYDMDMSNAARPDFAVIRKQLMEYSQILLTLMPGIEGEGNKVSFTNIAKQIGKTFDTIPDADSIVTPMTPEEKQQKAQQAQIEQTQETLKGASRPTEEALLRGAESTGIAQGTV